MGIVSSIAISGMHAAVRRLEVSARNVANARSAGPLPSADPAVLAKYPAAYAPKRVSQVELASGGTRADIVPVSPATTPVFDPTAAFADRDGMVAAPNVDFAGEQIEQLIARYDFTLNALILRLYGRMMKSLIDIRA